MAKFDVDVMGSTYEVDAPDEATAWKWAKTTHMQTIKNQTANRQQIEAQIASDPISRGARATSQETVIPRWLGGNPEATIPERIAAAPATRFAVGAAAPFLGGLQLLSNASGKIDSSNTMGQGDNRLLQQFEEMKQRGGSGGVDLMGMAGNVLSPVGLAAAKAITPATSVLGRAGQGTAIGAGFGALTPVTNGGDNYWADKATQVGGGAAIGAAIPLAVDSAIASGRGVRHAYRGLAEPFFQKGRDMAEGRDYVSVAGDRATELAAALRNPQSSVSGYKPTAAEIAAGLRNSVDKSGREELAGLQANVAQNYPRRLAVEQQQNQALVNAIRQFGKTPEELSLAEQARTTVTSPIREQALSNANIAGVKGPELESRLARQRNSMISALQNQGRMTTDAAQQDVLAHGGTVPITAGGTGNVSPSAYPVPGYPRIPGRYTFNADRVPEALSAAEDFGSVVANRKAQAGLTDYQLQSLPAHGQFPLEGRQVASQIESVMSTPGKRSSDVVTKALGEIRDKINQFSNDQGVIDSRDLYTIRKEAGNVVKKYAAENKNWDERLTSGLTQNVQGMIDNAIEGAGGAGWKDYLGKYASMSKDINQMKIGQALEGKLTSVLQGDDVLRPGVFANALQESSNTVQKAGAPRYSSIKDALYPQNMQAVTNVQDTLGRRALAKQLAQAGSSRASELTGTPEIVIPPTLSRVGMATRFLTRLVQGKGTSHMDQEMARDMLTNPERVSELMINAMARAKNMDEVVQALRKYSPLATQGAIEGNQ